MNVFPVIWKKNYFFFRWKFAEKNACHRKIFFKMSDFSGFSIKIRIFSLRNLLKTVEIFEKYVSRKNVRGYHFFLSEFSTKIFTFSFKWQEKHSSFKCFDSELIPIIHRGEILLIYHYVQLSQESVTKCSQFREITL